MPKQLLRIVAFLLVPCLVADPTMATAFSDQVRSAGCIRPDPATAAFESQALPLRFAASLFIGILAIHPQQPAIHTFQTLPGYTQTLGSKKKRQIRPRSVKKHDTKRVPKSPSQPKEIVSASPKRPASVSPAVLSFPMGIRIHRPFVLLEVSVFIPDADGNWLERTFILSPLGIDERRQGTDEHITSPWRINDSVVGRAVEDFVKGCDSRFLDLLRRTPINDLMHSTSRIHSPNKINVFFSVSKEGDRWQVTQEGQPVEGPAGEILLRIFMNLHPSQQGETFEGAKVWFRPMWGPVDPSSSPTDTKNRRRLEKGILTLLLVGNLTAILGAQALEGTVGQVVGTALFSLGALVIAGMSFWVIFRVGRSIYRRIIRDRPAVQLALVSLLWAIVIKPLVPFILSPSVEDLIALLPDIPAPYDFSALLCYVAVVFLLSVVYLLTIAENLERAINYLMERFKKKDPPDGPPTASSRTARRPLPFPDRRNTSSKQRRLTLTSA